MTSRPPCKATPDTVTIGGGAVSGAANPQLTSKEVQRDLTS